MLALAGVLFDEKDLRRLERAAEPVLRGLPSRRFGRSEERKLGFFAGRAAAAKALKQAGVEASLVPDPFFGYLRAYGPKGPLSNCSVNISHTKGAAAAVVAPSPAGIDLESATRQTSRVFSRVVNDDEKHTEATTKIQIADESVDYGLALWCAKEAFSKATGLGIKFGMQEFVVDLKSPSPFPARTSLQGPFDVKSPAIRYWRGPGLVVAVCANRQLLAGSEPVSMVFERV